MTRDGTGVGDAASTLASSNGRTKSFPRHRLESQLQREAKRYFDYVLPRPQATWFHVPNEGKRSRITGGILKRAGMRSGVPDNNILYNGRSFFVELKTETGRLSDSQKATIPEIEATGCPVAVARSLEEIEEALRGWGIPLRGSVSDFRNGRLPASPAKITTNRMTASEYRAVMGLDAAASPRISTWKPLGKSAFGRKKRTDTV